MLLPFLHRDFFFLSLMSYVTHPSFHHHGSRLDPPRSEISSAILSPQTAFGFFYPCNFPTTPTSSLVPRTFISTFAPFPDHSSCIFIMPFLSFTTMLVSSSSSLPLLLPSLHPLHAPLPVHAFPPFLSPSDQLWIPFSFLALSSLVCPLILHHFNPSAVSSCRTLPSSFPSICATAFSWLTSTTLCSQCSAHPDSTTDSMADDLADDDDDDDNSSAFSSPLPSQDVEAPTDQEHSQDSTFFAAATQSRSNIRHPSQLHFPPSLPRSPVRRPSNSDFDTVPPPSDPAPTTSPDATLSPEAPITPTPLSRTTTATAHDAKRRCVPDPDIHAAK
jgi:hypothetical protein